MVLLPNSCFKLGPNFTVLVRFCLCSLMIHPILSQLESKTNRVGAQFETRIGIVDQQIVSVHPREGDEHIFFPLAFCRSLPSTTLDRRFRSYLFTKAVIRETPSVTVESFLNSEARISMSRCKMFFTAHFRKKTKKKPLFSEEAHFSGKAASRITAIFWRTHFSATAAKNDPLGWERKRRHPAGSTKASQKISARAKNFFKKTLR